MYKQRNIAQILSPKNKEDMKKLDKAISQETDPYTKNKLLEQKMLINMFDYFSGDFARFRSPW